MESATIAAASSGRARACFVEITERGHERPDIAAEAWWRLANVQRLQSQWDDAIASARAGAELARAHGLRDTEADALNIEAAVWATRGDAQRAGSIFERMLELATRPITRANALQNLGGLAAEERRFDEAERLFGASRDAYRDADDLRGEACSLLNIGRLQAERGDPALAKETLQAAVHHSRTAGDMEMHAAALLNLGIVLGALDEHAEAEERITTATVSSRLPTTPCNGCAVCCSSPTLRGSRRIRSGPRLPPPWARDRDATSSCPASFA